MTTNLKKTLLFALTGILIAVAAWAAWDWLRADGRDAGLISGNGRIEATEIDVATKYAGRLADILVQEGDFVTAGQVLAHMQTEVLNAQRDEAFAQQQQALHAVASVKAQVRMRESDLAAAQAVVVQRESELENARRRQARSETLAKEGAASAQQLDDDRAAVRNMEATLTAARAQAAAAQSAIAAAKAQVTSAQSPSQPWPPPSPASMPILPTARSRHHATGACNTASPSPEKCLAPAARCST